MCTSLTIVRHTIMCLAIHGIYIWQHNIITNCNFEFFREATLTEIQPNIYIDHHNKILLSVPPNPQQITCLNPLRVILKSSEGVWFTKRPRTKNIKFNINAKRINGNYNVFSLYNPLRHVSLHSVFQTTFNYLMWQIDSQLGNNHRDIKSLIVSFQIRSQESWSISVKTHSIKISVMFCQLLNVKREESKSCIIPQIVTQILFWPMGYSWTPALT